MKTMVFTPRCTILHPTRLRSNWGVVTCNLTQNNGWWWAMEGEADSSFTDARIFSPDGSNILIDITQWPQTIGRVRWPFSQRSKWNTLQILAMLRIQSFKKKGFFYDLTCLNQVKDNKNGDIIQKPCVVDSRWISTPDVLFTRLISWDTIDTVICYIIRNASHGGTPMAGVFISWKILWKILWKSYDFIDDLGLVPV